MPEFSWSLRRFNSSCLCQAYELRPPPRRRSRGSRSSFGRGNCRRTNSDRWGVRRYLNRVTASNSPWPRFGSQPSRWSPAGWKKTGQTIRLAGLSHAPRQRLCDRMESQLWVCVAGLPHFTAGRPSTSIKSQIRRGGHTILYSGVLPRSTKDEGARIRSPLAPHPRAVASRSFSKALLASDRRRHRACGRSSLLRHSSELHLGYLSRTRGFQNIHGTNASPVIARRDGNSLPPRASLFRVIRTNWCLGRPAVDSPATRFSRVGSQEDEANEHRFDQPYGLRLGDWFSVGPT